MHTGIGHWGNYPTRTVAGARCIRSRSRIHLARCTRPNPRLASAVTARVFSFLPGINAPGLRAPMKLIDYARSPLHRRADTARSFHARRWKRSRWMPFQARAILPTFTNLLLSPFRFPFSFLLLSLMFNTLPPSCPLSTLRIYLLLCCDSLAERFSFHAICCTRYCEVTVRCL